MKAQAIPVPELVQAAVRSALGDRASLIASALRLHLLGWKNLLSSTKSLAEAEEVGWRVLLSDSMGHVEASADVEVDPNGGVRFAGLEEGPFPPLIAEAVAERNAATDWAVVLAPSVRSVAVWSPSRKQVVALEAGGTDFRDLSEKAYLSELVSEAKRMGEILPDSPFTPTPVTR